MSDEKVAFEDPLIDEIRRIRAEIAREHGNDVRRLCDHLRQLDDEDAAAILHSPQRKEESIADSKQQ